MTEQNLERLASRVADLIINARRVVVFTGAGVSTESGIPDFRSRGGIWEKFNPDDFTYQKFLSSVESRRKYWQMFRNREVILKSGPNPAHYAIAELHRMGKLDCVITQNIDGLHHRAGVPEDKILELHGNIDWIDCLNCGKRYNFEQVIAILNAGAEIPECEVCHGILKPQVVFFGEPLPENVLEEATARAQGCDLFIVIGSTLIVYPAAYMPIHAAQAGAKLVIINLSQTPMDDQATVLITAKAGEAMTEVMKQLKARQKRLANQN